MEAITQSLPLHYQPELLKRLDLLRRNDNFCDVTIVFNSQEFKAHKCVLAVSPFFAKYLTRGSRDWERNFIKVNLDGVTPSVMEDLLTYIYTGDILVTEENTKNLTVLRDYLFPQTFNTTEAGKPWSEDPCKYRQQLSKRLDDLRREESFCDVTVAITSQDFKAHKCVLAAASPFFYSLLQSDMRETKEHLIKTELEEATEAVIKEVLQYVYTGNATATEDTAYNLMVSADYLYLPSLKTVVGRFLSENLTIENCIFCYYFSEKYRCAQLMEKACEVVNSNFTAVMETDDFLSLNMNEVVKWLSSDDVVVSAEKDIFNGIVGWINQDRSEREDYFLELLSQMRLNSISRECLLELIKEDLLAKNTEICVKFLVEAIRSMPCDNHGCNLPKPRKCLDTHTDVIFVCGGVTALCYFPDQEVWYKLADMNFRHNHEQNPTQCRGRIYIGCKTKSNLKLMECYAPVHNFWSGYQVTHSFTSIVVLKGYLYAIFEESSFSYSRCLHRYDPENNYCDELRGPSTFRLNACIVADDQYLYVIGGFKGGEVLATTDRFHPEKGAWKKVAPVNEARSAACGTALNGKVYVAGGCHGAEALKTCEVYNPTTNEWQLMPSLINPRAYASMVTYKGNLYVLGGFRSRGNPNSRVLSVEKFDSEQSAWRENSVIPVESLETGDIKNKGPFKACSARLNKRDIIRSESFQ